MERELLDWWQRDGIVEKYLHRNDGADERFSFLDGPITANNPMGVHHAWGRTYKDLFQRYHAMLGKQAALPERLRLPGPVGRGRGREGARLQEQARHRDTTASPSSSSAARSACCKFAARQTEQSIRLGYWMDWDNSYFTMSDENNYTIWRFLKTCHERGWIYRGHDVMPWCPRCGTGISEHEIVTEGYQERHPPPVCTSASRCSIGRTRALLVWTTTPWTLTANVAAAVHPELTYVAVEQDGETLLPRRGRCANGAPRRVRRSLQRAARAPSWSAGATAGRSTSCRPQQGVEHRVIPWNEVSEAEGTGIVHIAPGCGKEDFALSQGVRPAGRSRRSTSSASMSTASTG